MERTFERFTAASVMGGFISCLALAFSLSGVNQTIHEGVRRFRCSLKTICLHMLKVSPGCRSSSLILAANCFETFSRRPSVSVYVIS